MAGIVSAVGDYDESFLVRLRVPQMIQTLADGIVERRSSARTDGVEGFFEFFGIVREGFAFHEFDGNVVVEIHYEHFVLRIARMREGIDRRGDIREFIAHASAVVNHETDSNRSVLLFEYGEILRLPIFKNAKVLLLQTGDKSAVRVCHIDG